MASGSGRPPVLIENYARFIVDFLDENTSLVLDDKMEGLTSQFDDLQIKKSSPHDFVTEKCNTTLKKAHVVERNGPEKLKSNTIGYLLCLDKGKNNYNS
ncbi:hypothetical protein EDC96DRAFT_574723 [Choanephora cucurbitarum]|nr:hypothetical protein EDC96DRAFT_574723 [Choanephora cucurbitarum]